MHCTHFSSNAYWLKSLPRGELLGKVTSQRNSAGKYWSEVSLLQKNWLLKENMLFIVNSLTFRNSSQLQHLASMSSYNRISHLAVELLRRIPGHVWKHSCNETLVSFYFCSLEVQEAYTEGSVRLNKFQPSSHWKALII